MQHVKARSAVQHITLMIARVMPEQVLKKSPCESEIYFNPIICISVMQFRNKEINLSFNNCLQDLFMEIMVTMQLSVLQQDIWYKEKFKNLNYCQS